MRLSIVTMVLLFLGYIYAFIYTFVILNVPIFKKLRIQQTKTPMKLMYRRLPLILFNMSLTLLLAGIGVFFFSEFFSLDFPDIWNFLIQLALLLIFEDFYFYFIHLFMHKNKFIYRHIHAIHHQSSAPYPLDILYVNPLETLFVSIAILMSFVAVYFIFGSINIYVFWGYQLFRIFHETDVHSGIKSIIFKWLPFYGSAEHHDSHHSNLNGNYASTFSFWDHMLGTKIKNKKN